MRSLLLALLLVPATTHADPERLSQAPDTELAAFGGILFVGTYAPSFLVAMASSNTADRWLFAPVVGPFIDLGTRSSSDTWTTLALVGNGILQSTGVIAMVWSYVFPPKRARLRVTPTQLGGGLGVTLTGAL